jgi:hypothetical protein
MYDPDQLRLLIIRPTLLALGLHSPDAEELMMGTCAQESRGGTYLKQVNGIAYGAWQMEPATHDDIWKRFLPNQHIKCSLMVNHCQIRTKPDSSIMVYHLTYACAMARLHYFRKPGVIPKTLAEQAEYWKVNYNSLKGKGTPEEYITSYEAFIGKPKKGAKK